MRFFRRKTGGGSGFRYADPAEKCGNLAVEKEFRAHDGPVTDVAWHPRLPVSVSASEDLNVRFWNLETGIQLGELHGIASQPEQRPEKLTISPNSQFLGVRCAAFGVGFFEPTAFQPAKK